MLVFRGVGVGASVSGGLVVGGIFTYLSLSVNEI